MLCHSLESNLLLLMTKSASSKTSYMMLGSRHMILPVEGESHLLTGHVVYVIIECDSHNLSELKAQNIIVEAP